MDHNSIPNLIELVLRHSAADQSDEISIRVELRIAPTELDGPENTTFKVALKRAWLDLDLSGLDVVPGTRLGEPTTPNEILAEKKITEEVVRNRADGGQATLGISANPKSIAADVAVKVEANKRIETKKSLASSASDSATHMRVKARGGLMWEITEPLDNSALDATYLNNDALCNATPTKGANAKFISLIALAKQRDIILEASKNSRLLSFFSPNHEKLLKVLIAKSLAVEGDKYNGVLKLSASESTVEE